MPRLDGREAAQKIRRAAIVEVYPEGALKRTITAARRSTSASRARHTAYRRAAPLRRRGPAAVARTMRRRMTMGMITRSLTMRMVEAV